MTLPSARRRVVLLGATGSIGESALRVIEAHPEQLELVAIAANSNLEPLARIAAKHGVTQVALHDRGAAARARTSGLFASGTQILEGTEGLVALASLAQADVVLVAVVGTTGLEPALATLKAGKDLALASKEILVLAGKFVMEAARNSRSRLLPVDSEHAALAQCLAGYPTESIARIVLTASGGSFRDWPLERLGTATKADALRHPNWSMGPKITVDSATLANKGLELIEAQWLFGLKPEQCQAMIHTQSVVHALVEFVDGVMLTQWSPPSMTFPIQRALLPDHAAKGVDAPLPLDRPFSLDLRPVDLGRYPLFKLAQHSLMAGGVSPAIFNAANEVAVAAFLAEQIPFLAISEVVDHALANLSNFEPPDLSAVIAVDHEARRIATEHFQSLVSRP